MMGLGFTAERPRRIKGGWEYTSLMPPAAMTEQLLDEDAGVRQTVQRMAEVIQGYKHQLNKVAPLLKGKDLEETCRKVFNHFHDNYQYARDPEGYEVLKTPSRFYNDRFFGGDCDDFSISVGAALLLLNISFKIRVTAYENSWQHVYIIVPKPGGGYYTIDCVLDQFDYEKPYSKKYDYTMMPLQTALQGIPIVVLNGFSIEGDPELESVLRGDDLDELITLLGLGEVPSAQKTGQALYDYLVKTRNAIAKDPGSMLMSGGAKAHLQMFDYAIANWNTPNREKALDILAQEESKWQAAGMPQELKGLEGILLGDDELENEYTLLGKVSIKKFWGKVKDSAKNVWKEAGKVAKKTVQAVKKYNPYTLSRRVGYLLAMKLNIGGMARTAYPGYFTWEAARAKKFSRSEWEAGVKARQAFEKKILSLHGKKEALQKAILNSWGKTKPAALSGLGFVETATLLPAAIPILESASDLDKAGVKSGDDRKWYQKIFDFLKKNGNKAFPTSDLDASAQPGRENAAPPPDENLPPGLKDDKKSNTGLYVGLAVGAVSLVAAAAFLFRGQPQGSRPALSGLPTHTSVPRSPYPPRKKKAKKIPTILLK
jgi:hypothetical protein